jgi:hypothetical protein
MTAVTAIKPSQDFSYTFDPKEAEEEAELRRFNPAWDILSEEALLTTFGQRYLIDGFLTANGLTVAFGPPKDGGKTAFWLRTARRASQAKPVFGRTGAPGNPGQVLYLATEGQAGLRDRIEALQLVEGPAPNFNFIVKPLNLLDRRDVDALLFGLGEDYELLVIDTLGRLVGAAGADENTSDMQRLIASLDVVRDRSGVQLVLIHHGAKGGSSGPRGHGSLMGAADCVVEHAKLGDGSRTATVISSRDSAAGPLMRYRLRPIALPPTNYSPSRSSVIAEEMDEAMPVPAVVKTKAKSRRASPLKEGLV